MNMPVKKQANILIAEDNSSDILLMNIMMRKANIVLDLHHISDGETIKNYLTKVQGDSSTLPDLVLLDLNLPKCSGIELLSFIKNTPELAGIPVCMLTGSDKSKDLKQALSMGACHFATKPLNLKVLQHIVSRVPSLELVRTGTQTALCVVDTAA